jgi:hypothetical protein
MTYAYCRRWNMVLGSPIEPLDETQARQQYERVGSVTIQLLDPRGETICACEIATKGDSAKVLFLDELFRIATAYIFTKISDKLFLQRAVSYGYANDTFKTIFDSDLIIIYKFDPHSTTVNVEERNKLDGTVRRSKRDGYDPNENWEDIPSFGQWESLMRKER